MERTLSAEERIRKAEEIYQRRKMQNGIRVPTKNVNSKGRYEISLFKKLIIQIIACLLIYLVFYLVHNSDYIFSKEIITKTKEFLSYDINFEEAYKNIEKFYNEKIAVLFKNDSDEKKEDIKEQVNETVSVEENTNVQTETNLNVNEQALEEVQVVSEENEKSLTQMEIDANYIKENYSLIVPLNGVISSHFGEREPTEIISANHEGIDIAADEGTVFYASMDGVVTDILTEGGYGNHIYIQNEDITTLYAHCSNIYLNIGDKVIQGQEIGEVGETGNATGPHLHFEIRREDRVIDPEYILEF